MSVAEPLPVLPWPPEPVAVRHAPVDVLRGLAMLGILVMNIQAFAMPEAYYGSRLAFPSNEPLTGPDYAVWLVSHLLFDEKMVGLFAILFGAGIVLMTGRREAGAARALHYRRMAVLLAIGLLHAYGLWYGDILFFYAVCGMLLYPARRLWPGAQLALGLALFLAGAVALTYIHRVAAPSPEPQQELAAYSDGYLAQMAMRARQAFNGQTWIFAIWIWRLLGLMLLGMALVRWRILTGQRSAMLYAGLLVAGLLLGLPTVAWGVWMVAPGDHYQDHYNYFGSLLVALGWTGAVMLACKSPRLTRWLRPLGAVGQMALTNYLLQSVICTTIFYGYGFGYFGDLDRVGQALVVGGVWGVELAASALWLAWFRFGPVEWLWRSATYRHWQPLRRPASP